MLKKYKCFQIELMQGIAVIQMNPPPLNQVSALWLQELKKAFTHLFSSSSVTAVIITGTGRHFISGMDVSWVIDANNCDYIQPNIEKANQLLFMIEKGPKPVVAAINGNCTRGGMEVAMACHYRIASEHLSLGLLDVRFGLIPCMGGTQRLPRLIGIKPALEMMARGAAVSAEKAKAYGLIDEAAPPEKLIEQSISAVQAFVAGHINFKMCISCRRFDQLSDRREKKKIIQRIREKLQVSEKGYLAPFKVVEAVESGLGLNFEKDLQKEAALFCECAASDIAGNLIRLFNQSRRSRHFEWLKGENPRKIRSVGILGTGTDASVLAAFLLRCGFNVWLWNKELKQIRRGLNMIRSMISGGVENGFYSREQSNQWLTQKLKLTKDLEDLKQAELVIECFNAEMSITHQLFGQLEKICRPDTLMALTASISTVSQAAKALRHPERVIALRFMKPLEGIRLLEIASAPTVSDGVLEAAVNFTLKIRKTPFLVTDGPGFFIPRLLNALLNEFGHLAAEGTDPLKVDALFTHFGFPMPLTRMADLAGMDLLCRQTEQLAEYAPDRWQIPPVFTEFTKHGWFGQKKGLGWYDYRQHPPEQHQDAFELVKSFKNEQQKDSSQTNGRRTMFQLLSRLINETAYMLDEGLSNTAAELDMATVFGIGFPPYHGGVLKFADSVGIKKVYQILQTFESAKGKRFTPSPMIEKMVKDEKTFYDLI